MRHSAHTLLAGVATSALLLGAPAAMAQSDKAGTRGNAPAATEAQGQQGAQGQRGHQGQRGQGQRAGQAQGMQAGGQVAQACLDDLRQLSQRMDEDGYWLTGWGSRWGYGVGGPMGAPASAGPRAAVPPAGTVAPGAPASATEQQRRAEADDDATRGAGAAPADRATPWGPATRYGIMAPSYQIRTLYAAANVLAHRNDQEGCETVTAELRQLYDGYVRELRQAGVEPGAVRDWRVERILMAKPVTQIDRGAINIADVTGTEVRTPNDRDLGTVSDVLLDAPSGDISYVILERGGFLGLGEHHVAVPWQALKATPNMELLVLDVSEQTLEQAPRIDPDRFGNAQAFGESRRQVDRFWSQHVGQGGGQQPAGRQQQRQ